jgi:hypothetical protein
VGSNPTRVAKAILRCEGPAPTRSRLPLSSNAIKVLDELRTLTNDEGHAFPTRRGTTGHRSESWKPVTRFRETSVARDSGLLLGAQSLRVVRNL